MATPEIYLTTQLGPQGGLSTAKNELSSDQYRTIGKTLMISEAACLETGVPWLPPLKNRRKLALSFDAPLDEFIRISLVTVNAKTLEQYCYDLDTISATGTDSEKGAAELHIDSLNLVERYALCGLIFVALFAICYLFSTWMGVKAAVAILMSMMTSIAAAAVASISCLEPYRRNNFYCVLHKELSRRRGIDQSNTRGIKLVSLET